MKKLFYLPFLLLVFISGATAQKGVGYGNDFSAILDLRNGSNKGLLIPQALLTNANSPAPVPVDPLTSRLRDGMLVYNTNRDTVGTSGLKGKGFYFWDSLTATTGRWVLIQSSNIPVASNAWLITGNTGTNSATNFIGTTDNQALAFRVENTQAGFLGPASSSVTSLGIGSSATGQFSTALGANAQAVQSAVGIGINANASQQFAIAIGNSSAASITGGIAIGSTATASSQDGIAIGSGAMATTSPNTLAIGTGAKATNQDATAFGRNSTASGLGGNAFGNQSQATGQNSIAIGTSAIASGQGTIAIGDNSSAAANNSIILGDNSSTTASNTIIIGNGLTTAASDVLILGNIAKRIGMGTTTPTEKLDVVGNIKFSGALMPNGDPGNIGEVLTSAGAGAAPTWQTGITMSRFTATPPLTYNSGTGVFGITQATTSTIGYLSSTDWNTFNNKVDKGLITGSGLTMATSRLLGRTTAGTGAIEEITVGSGLSLSGGILTSTGSGGTVTNFSFTNGNGFTGIVTNPTTTPALSLTLQNATTSQAGQLTAADWNTFNNKVGKITLNTPSLIYNTPVKFSLTGDSAVGTLSLINQTANTVLAGPASGAAAAPTFRALAPADVNASAWTITGNSGINPADNFVGTSDAQPLVFKTNGSERMRILSTGNVGIGTTGPPNALSIVATNPLYLLGVQPTATYATDSLLVISGGVVKKAPTGSGAWSTSGNGGTDTAVNFLGTTDLRDVVFRTNNTRKMTLTSGGFLGIGIAAPFNGIHLVSDGGVDQRDDIRITTYSASTTPAIIMERSRGTSAGRANLQSGDGLGSVRSFGQVNGASVTLTNMNSIYNGNGTDILSSIVFSASNSTRLTIDQNGHIVPGANGTQNLGLTASRWNLAFVDSLTATSLAGSGDRPVFADASGALKIGSGANTAWLLTGNAGTNPGTNFIGTTDGVDFVVRTNSLERMRILGAVNGSSQAGWIGMGAVTVPRAPVDMAGAFSAKNVLTIQNTASDGYSSIDILDNTNAQVSTFGFGNPTIGNGAIQNKAYFFTYSKDFLIGTGSNNNGVLYIRNSTNGSLVNGTVGINTNTPNVNANLDVVGPFKLGTNGSVTKTSLSFSGSINVFVNAGAGQSNDGFISLPVTLSSAQASVAVSPLGDLPSGIVIAFAKLNSASQVKIRFTNTTGFAQTVNTTFYCTVTEF